MLEKRQKAQQSLQITQTKAESVRPYATWILIGVNVLIWIITQGRFAFEAKSFGEIALRFLILPADAHILVAFGALDPFLIHQGQYWRLLTANFLHVAGYHLALNMLFLWMVGEVSEKYLGTFRFVLIYFLSGCFGYLASCLVFPYSVSLGASSALYGVLASLVWFFSRHHRAARQAKVPALVVLWGTAFLAIASGFLMPGTNNAAHIGGFFWGTLLSFVISPYYENGEDSHRLNHTWPFVALISFVELAIAILILAPHFTSNLQFNLSLLPFW